MQLLVEWVEVSEGALNIRMRTDGLAPAGPVDTLGSRAFRRPEARRAEVVITPDGNIHRPRPRMAR